MAAIAAVYADFAGNLPMRITLQAIYTPKWRLSLTIFNSELRTKATISRCTAITPFTHAIWDRFDLMVTDHLDSTEFSADTWQCRIEGEALNLSEMMRWIDEDSIGKGYDMYSGFEGELRQAIFWKKHLILIWYEQMKQNNNPFFARTAQ